MGTSFDSFSGLAGISNQGFTATGALKEKFDLAGLNVSVEQDAISALQNSAEEVGFASDNYEEPKRLKRKDKGEDSKLRDRLQKAHSVNKSLLKMHRFKSFRERAMQLKNMLASNPNLTLDTIREKLFKGTASKNGETLEGSDVNQKCQLQDQNVELYLLLHDVLKDLDVSGADQRIANTIKAAINTLDQENHQAINAVLVAMSSSDLQVDSISDAEALLETNTAFSFANVCTNLNNISDLYAFLKDQFQDSGFSQAISSMQRSVATCLSAVGQEFDFDKDKLAVVGQNLSFLHQIRSVQSLVDDLVAKFKDVISNSDSSELTKIKSNADKIDRTQFALNLYELSKRTLVTNESLRGLYKEVETLDATSEVLLAQNLLNTVKRLNENFFSSMEERNRMVEATLSFVDELVDKEDEYLASLEEDDF